MLKGVSSKRKQTLGWKPCFPGLTMPLFLALLVLLPACSTTVTRLTIPPAKCSDFVSPDAWKPVIGADVSKVETQKDWAAAFVAQTGRLEAANADKSYVFSVVTACEKREQQIYESLNGKRRRFFGLF